MAENNTDGFKIRSSPASDEFYALLRNVLPEFFLDLYNNKREEIYSRFNGLSGDGQHRMLVFLRSILHRVSCTSLNCRLFAVDFMFSALESTLTMCADPWHLDPSIVELSRAIAKVETVATFLISRRSSLNMFGNINFSHFEAGTLHHTQRTLPDQHNSHQIASINMNNTNLNYSTNTQSHSQRSIASSHGIFQATEISPYGDPGASSSSTAAASHGEARATRDDVTAGHSGIFQATEISPYGDPGASSSSTAAASHGEARATRGIFQATEISPYGDPGVSSSSTAAASHGQMSNSLQSHSQRPAASHNNPPGHDAVSNVPVGHSGIFQAAEISPYGDPGASSSSTAAASHGEMSNSLQSHSQRPAASHNNPPGQDAIINIPGDGEFTSGRQTIPAEARATRDGETAGHSKFFEILLPVSFKYAYKAGEILKSNYHILPPSIKTSGCLAVVIAFVAAFSSLVGFSLSTFRPSTLPFGWNPQHMLQIMHLSAVFSLGYAFIGIMCHEFLRDDPIIFWMVGGLAYAVLTAVLVVIIRRR